MNKPVFLMMPQWQGSASSRAMQLVDGADLLREDLPRSATREVAVPLEAGDAMGTPVARLSSVLRAHEEARKVHSALAHMALNGSVAGGPAITLGGDAAISLAGIEAAVNAANEAPVAVIWFDANPTLQHPSTSPSGAAAGMVLRHALGDGAPDLALRQPVDPALVSFVGTRAADVEESAEIARFGIPLLPHDGDAPEHLAERVSAHLVASGASRVFVHIDLDVLDPASFSAVHSSVPFGLSTAQLIAAVRAAVATLPLAGATICEFAPASAEVASDDLPTVLRILGALTSGPGAPAAGATGQ